MAQKTKIKWKRLFLGAFCIYVAIRLLCGFGEIYTLREQKARLDVQIEEAMAQHAVLEQQVDKMSQSEEMERVAREQLGYVMPGEISLKKIEDNNRINE